MGGIGRMSNAEFVGYVGPADLHDGTIVRVEANDEMVSVAVRAESGKVLRIIFAGVREVSSHEPEGMLLCALTELREELSLKVGDGRWVQAAA